MIKIIVITDVVLEPSISLSNVTSTTICYPRDMWLVWHQVSAEARAVQVMTKSDIWTSVCRSQGVSSLVVGYSGNYQCGVWRHSIKQSEPRHLILFNNKISLIPAQVTTERDKQSLLSAGPITDIYFTENFFILFILIPWKSEYEVSCIYKQKAVNLNVKPKVWNRDWVCINY